MLNAQSAEPRPAPKTKSAAASSGNVDKTASIGSAAQMTTVAAGGTFRQPYLAIKAAAGGIAIIEPTPRQSRSSPSVPSWSDALDFAKGTSDAHTAAPIPPTKKSILVERCCSFATIAGSPGAFKVQAMLICRRRRDAR